MYMNPNNAQISNFIDYRRMMAVPVYALVQYTVHSVHAAHMRCIVQSARIELLKCLLLCMCWFGDT